MPGAQHLPPDDSPVQRLYRTDERSGSASAEGKLRHIASPPLVSRSNQNLATHALLVDSFSSLEFRYPPEYLGTIRAEVPPGEQLIAGATGLLAKHICRGDL